MKKYPGVICGRAVQCVLQPILWLLASLAFAGNEPTSAKAMTIQDTWSLPGILGGGVKTNDAYTDGNFFLTYPAYSTIGRDGWLGGDVLFIEPYTSWGEEGEVAVSLGLGWRHLFSGQSVSPSRATTLIRRASLRKGASSARICSSTCSTPSSTIASGSLASVSRRARAILK